MSRLFLCFSDKVKSKSSSKHLKLERLQRAPKPNREEAYKLQAVPKLKR